MHLNRPVVLLIDDHPESLAMHALGLLAMGFDPVAVTDAAHAFKCACEIRPDAIVATATPADVSVVELTRQLREDARTQAAGIIMLASQPVDAIAADATCDRFLFQPCLTDALGEEIRAVLASRRTNTSDSAHIEQAAARVR